MPFFTLALSNVNVTLGGPDYVEFASFLSGTATEWSWLTTAGHRVDVFGTGFTYSDGRATAGTVEQIVMDFGNDSPEVFEFWAFGLSFPAATLDDSGESFWRILNGNDTLTGPRAINLPQDSISTLIGDGYATDADGAIGGKDIINAGDVKSHIFGDFAYPESNVTGGSDTINGSNLDDRLVGDCERNGGTVTGGADKIYGKDGKDKIYGDVVFTSGGILNGGDDLLYGGDGDDSIYGEYKDAVTQFLLVGGDDKIYGEAGRDEMFGNSGNDILDGGLDIDTMNGGTGDDQFYVDNSLDLVGELAGEGTADRVLTSVSYTLAANQSIELFSTTFSPGTTAINLTGNNLANIILGNNGINVINGGTGIDRMTGLNGSDLYVVDNLSDTVIEGANGGTADRVLTSVNYTLGQNQQIELFSTTNSLGTAAISMVGNNLANRILGNNGANVINGGLGNDVMTGALGADKFRFDSVITGGGNVDTIADFVHLIDDFQLAQGVFTNIGGGLDAAEFRLGTTATTAAQRIIYDGVTGNLFFDADGTGAAAQVQFAKVTASTVLDINDFIMI